MTAGEIPDNDLDILARQRGVVGVYARIERAARRGTNITLSVSACLDILQDDAVDAALAQAYIEMLDALAADEPKAPPKRGVCWFCSGSFQIRNDGRLRHHTRWSGGEFSRRSTCIGAGTTPSDRTKGEPCPPEAP